MSRDQKTFVILTPGFPLSESDSTCLPMQQQFVLTIRELYPDIDIVVISFQYPYFIRTYDWFGVTVMSYNGRNKGGFARLLLRRKILKDLKKINSQSKIIGILSFWFNECAAVGRIFSRKFNIQHFCWILGQDARKENVYPGRLKPEPGELIALSDFLQEEFERNHGVKPFTVIAAGVNEKFLPPPNPIKTIDLMAAGSLIPLKRFEIFIEIVAKIKKQNPGIRTLLAGDGPEKENLQKLIQQLDLTDSIDMPGELPHDQLLKEMSKTKLFLHPSSYEGFSGVCLEALSCGAEVVSFCQPMKQSIPHWHIVNSKNEMTEKTLQILKGNFVREQNIFFPISETVKKMMSLFR